MLLEVVEDTLSTALWDKYSFGSVATVTLFTCTVIGSFLGFAAVAGQSFRLVRKSPGNTRPRFERA